MVRKPIVSLEPNVRKYSQRLQVTELDRSIGRRLKRARWHFSPRDRSGFHISYTQEDIAQVLDLHRPAVAAIEAGRRKLSVAELVRLAEFFRVEEAELLAFLTDQSEDR